MWHSEQGFYKILPEVFSILANILKAKKRHSEISAAVVDALFTFQNKAKDVILAWNMFFIHLSLQFSQKDSDANFLK